MIHPPDSERHLVGQFSLLAILVFTLIFAVLSVSLGYLYRALIDDKKLAMGQFIIFTALSPLVTLTVISSMTWVVRKVLGKRRS